MWLNEFSELTDKRLLWDLIKYRVRQVSIKYSKERACEKRKKISDIETSLKLSEEKCNESPTVENQIFCWKFKTFILTSANVTLSAHLKIC